MISGVQRLIGQKIRDKEAFIERSLDLAERMAKHDGAEERFLAQAVKAEYELNEFQAGRRDWP